VAGYASNFVSSNDLFAPPAAAWTNRESTAQLGIRPAAGGANAKVTSRKSYNEVGKQNVLLKTM